MRSHLRDGLLQLNEVLLELVVPQESIAIVGWIVDDTAAELRLGSNRNDEQCG